MSSKRTDLESPAGPSDVSAFLRQVATTKRTGPRGARGRLIFAMDATASREPTWDRAARIQSSMFVETRDLGGLEVQLCYFRGFRDFAASPWYQDADALLKRMNRVFCEAGLTQIGRVLEHALSETTRRRVDAIVFVGDCMEEDRDRLADLAGKLGLAGVPVFVFQEGRDGATERSFREIARLSGGAWCPFDSSSPKMLRDLLAAVAVFAAGGRQALTRYGEQCGGAVLQLTDQMTRKGG
ncbi:hypothetical protein CKO25_04615 [Thiocapsa imhoffii]|uniref:VWA domain-containing protein n=1 Tax=Thiocapsa imhoffii TaxID=382777 RepID=A0A9X0WFV5_9GAMM|nr:VWA domain-containing protein [Thiocapsa imhoffii]MBK1643951.1 hypothetical protein [Thiocapsa imhoffii]